MSSVSASKGLDPLPLCHEQQKKHMLWYMIGYMIRGDLVDRVNIDEQYQAW